MILADFHVHTTWSDGRLPMRDVVDLFGRSGHDVIAITDHVVGDGFFGRAAHRFELTLDERNFDRYLDEIAREGERAMAEYGMLVLAGVELTHNGFSRSRSAHALALGVDHFVSADGSIDEMLRRAKAESELVVACHPHEQSDWFANTYYLWEHRSEVSCWIDLWEVACRWDVFPPVSRAKFNFIGNSDFHDVPHLYAWKTLLGCEKTPEAVFATLRENKKIALTRLTEPGEGSIAV